MTYDDALQESKVFCDHFMPAAGIAVVILCIIFIYVFIKKKR